MEDVRSFLLFAGGLATIWRRVWFFLFIAMLMGRNYSGQLVILNYNLWFYYFHVYVCSPVVML
jgi:hypothetical protein